jgi:hypothetical protein
VAIAVRRARQIVLLSVVCSQQTGREELLGWRRPQAAVKGDATADARSASRPSGRLPRLYRRVIRRPTALAPAPQRPSGIRADDEQIHVGTTQKTIRNGLDTARFSAE